MELKIRVPYPAEHDCNALITKSEIFRGLLYEVRGKTLIIYTLQNGVLALPLKDIGDFVSELKEIAVMWRDQK